MAGGHFPSGPGPSLWAQRYGSRRMCWFRSKRAPSSTRAGPLGKGLCLLDRLQSLRFLWSQVSGDARSCPARPFCPSLGPYGGDLGKN